MLNESVIKVLKNGMRNIAEHMQMVGDFLYIEGCLRTKIMYLFMRNMFFRCGEWCGNTDL